MDIPSEEYSEEYFQIIRKRYLLQDAWMKTRIMDVISSLNPSPGETILDVGCSVGTISLECRKRGALVTAVDYSDIAIRMARELELEVLGENGIEYRSLDVKDISSLSRKFDKVVTADFIEHISRELFEIFISGVKHLMRVGSIMVIYTPNGSVKPNFFQKFVRLLGLLSCFKNDDLKREERHSFSRRSYLSSELEVTLDEKYEYLHVDVKTASYLHETLIKNNFKIHKIKVSRGSSRLQKLPYPFNILWGGHLCVIAEKVCA